MSADRDMMLRLSALGHRANAVAQEAHAIEDELNAILTGLAPQGMTDQESDAFWEAFSRDRVTA